MTPVVNGPALTSDSEGVAGLSPGTYTFLAIGISIVPPELQEEVTSLFDHSAVVDRVADVAKDRGVIVFATSAPRCQIVLAYPSAWEAVEAVVALYGSSDAVSMSVGICVGVYFADDDPASSLPVLKARGLADLAMGGQVFLSASTYEVLRDGAPPDWDFEFLGTVHFDFQVRREAVTQLLHSSLPSIRAFLNTEERVRPALPHRFGLLIGRENVIDDVHGRLSRYPVVTITGTAGIGKSHLASKIAVDLRSQEEDVVWVNLTGVEREDHVFEQLALALGLRSKNFPLRKLILRQLSGREVFFVLDGCDRCVEPVKNFIEDATRTNGPSFLVTSPKRLGLPNESTVQLEPLPNPNIDDFWTAADLEEHDATALFMDRARECDPEFTVDDTEAAAIAKICRHFSGHPLSIVLAAKRIRQIGPIQMIFDLKTITGRPVKRKGPGSISSRHQSLLQALEWTYDSLSSEARQLLKSLAPTRGSWNLNMAATLSDTTVGQARISLEELIDTGFVEMDSTANYGDYYRLPRAVAEMLGTKFESEQERQSIFEQHCLVMISVLGKAAAALGGDDEVAALDEFDEHKLDIYAALEYTLRPDGHIATFTEAIIKSWPYWYTRNQIDDCLRLIDQATKRFPSEDSLDLGRLLNLGGALASKSGQVDRARRYLRRALRIGRRINHNLLEASAGSNMGWVMWSEGQFEKAAQAYAKAIQILPADAPALFRANLFVSWSTSLMDSGRLIEAREALAQAGAMAGNASDLQFQWTKIIAEGQLRYREGSLAEAFDRFFQSFRIAARIKDHASMARTLYWISEHSFAIGEIERAAQLLGAVRSQARKSGINLYPINELRIADLERRCADHLSTSGLSRCFISGSLTVLDDLISNQKQHPVA